MANVATLPQLRSAKVPMHRSLLDRTPPAGSGRSRFEFDLTQQHIFEALDDPNVRQVTLEAGSQLFKSEVMLTTIVHHMRHEAGTIFLALPGMLTRDRFVLEKFRPMLDSNEDLANRIQWGRGRSLSRDNISFVGGLLTFAYGRSNQSMRSISARLCLGDELDAFPKTPDSDSPAELIRQRGSSYGSDYKMLVCSTPTDEFGWINMEFQRSTAECLHVDCALCGKDIALSTNEVVSKEYAEETDTNEDYRLVRSAWDKMATLDGVLCCPHCSQQLTDASRWGMLRESANFAQTNPDPEPHHRGFNVGHLASLVTRADSLWEQSQRDPKSFMTGYMGVPFKAPAVIDVTLEMVLNLYVEGPPTDREMYPYLPARPNDRTMGVDIQKNRLEYICLDWYDQFPYVVEYGRLWVTDSKSKHKIPFDLLDVVMGRLRPNETHIDRGGAHRSIEFKAAARDHLRRWERLQTVRYVKGEDKGVGERMIWGNTVGGGPLDLRVNVDESKAEVHRLLNSGSMAILRTAVPADFPSQLLAEKLVWKLVRGKVRQAWEKESPDARNEGLDTYALAVSAHDRRGAMKLTFPSGELMEAINQSGTGGAALLWEVGNDHTTI